MSNTIINNRDILYTNERFTLLRYYKSKWIDIDLMALGLETTERKSLKQIAINLKYPNIQDLPIPHYAAITKDQVHDIIKYNINDCHITLKLFDYLKDKIVYRFNASQKYGVNLINCNKSKIADKLMAKFYSNISGLDYKEFKDLKTYYKVINIGNCISKKVKFDTPILKELYNKFQNAKITDTRNELKEKVIFGNVRYNLGTGGLHSADTPCAYDNKTHILRDADVTSYYPNIVLNEKIYPKHLSTMFLDVAKYITTERTIAKHNRDILTADTLKIVINAGGFGKFGYEFSWLYDREALVKVTINGQLFLLMLIEKLVENSIDVISANTDGIVCKFKKDQENTYYSICKEWEHLLSFELEYTDYSLYVRRDVNNYIAVSGKVKTKGDFIKDIQIEKGYDMPIIAVALQNYFVKGIPVDNTLLEHRDIYDFCKSQRTGDKFVTEFHTLNRNTNDIEITKLQKNNRYYVSNSGGSIIKYSDPTLGGDKTRTSLCSGYYVTMFNNAYELKDFSKYNINYDYYRKAIYKIIDQIIYRINYSKTVKTNVKLKRKPKASFTGTLFDN